MNLSRIVAADEKADKKKTREKRKRGEKKSRRSVRYFEVALNR